MLFNTKQSLAGSYFFQVKDKFGNVKKELECPNLILDSGLNLISGATTGDKLYIGTGTSAPISTQTSLDSLSATTTTKVSYNNGLQISVLPYYRWASVLFRFGIGSLNGNYSEVGHGASSTNLFSRALIVDGNGNPTTLTVLSDEQLDVTYRLEMYFSPDDIVGTINIPGVGSSVGYTLRPTAINSGGRNAYNNNTAINASGYAGWGMGASFAAEVSTTDNIFGSVGVSGNGFPFSAGTMAVATNRTTLASATATVNTTNYPSVGNNGASCTNVAYVTNNFYRDVDWQFGSDVHNGTWQHILYGVAFGGTYQILFNTPITKTSLQRFIFKTRTTWGRYTP